MIKRRKAKNSFKGNEVEPVLRLWMLRILVTLGGMNNFMADDYFACDEVAAAVGLGKWIDNVDFNKTTIRSTLRKLLSSESRKSNNVEVSHPLKENVEKLAKLVGLSIAERRILEFIVLLHTESALDNATESLKMISGSKLTQVLSKVLDLPENEVRYALSPRGTLSRSGLILVSRLGVGYLKSFLDLLSDQFTNEIISADADSDPSSFMRDIIKSSAPATLGLNAYPHTASSLNLLLPYLDAAFESRRRGVNILLYGKPGTGKSELSKVLSQSLDCQLLEIASEDSAGDAVDGENRLRAFRVAQGL